MKPAPAAVRLDRKTARSRQLHIVPSVGLKNKSHKRKMRITIIIILEILLAFNVGFAQNIKRFLNEEDLNKLMISNTIIKHIDDKKYDLGFSGDLIIKKYNKKLKTHEIGTWIRKDSKYGDDAIMTFDSVGRLLDYKEFNKSNIIIFDCVYWYDTINGNYYRLENLIARADNGTIITKGHRYWLIKKDKFGIYQQSKKRRFGKWEEFDYEGNLMRTKEYGEIE